MNLNELQKKFAEKTTNDKSSTEYNFCCLFEEVSEAFEGFRENDKEEIGEGFAKAAVLMLGLCERLGISLQEEIAKLEDDEDDENETEKEEAETTEKKEEIETKETQKPTEKVKGE